MDWNPNSPELRGMEFMPRQAGTLPGVRIASPSAAVAQRFDVGQTVTENWNGVWINADRANGRMMVELLLAGSEAVVDGNITTTICRPNGGTFASGLDNSPGAVGMAEEDVLAQDPIDLDKYLFNGPSAADADFSLTFDTTGLFTGDRILAWRLVVVASRGVQEFSGSLEPHHTEPSAPNAWEMFVQPDPPISAPSSAPETRVYDFGEAIQRTLTPITVADLEEFDTGGLWLIKLHMPDGTVDDDTLRVYQVWLEVDHCAQNQKTRAIVTFPAAGLQWVPFGPLRPDNTNGLDLVNAQDLTLVLRQPRWGGLPVSRDASITDRFTVPYIEALPGSQMPVGVTHYSKPGLRADGSITALGEATDRIVGLNLGSGGTQRVESQPYVNVTRLNDSFGFLNLEQEITTAGAETYHGVVVPVVAEGTPAHAMTVELRRRSDNNLMATATMSAARFYNAPEDPAQKWRRVQIPFASAVALAAATQYYLDFSDLTDGLDSQNYWLVPVMFTTAELGVGTTVPGTATFGGTTDQATISTDMSTADIPALLYQEPDVVDSFAIDAERIDFDSGSEDCGITGIPYVHLTWEASPDSETFAYYEVQSLTNPQFETIADLLNLTFSDEWRTLAKITDINAEGTGGGDGFADFEAAMGVSTYYRVRVVSTYGIAGPWSDVLFTLDVPPSLTLLADGECGYWFTHNAWPEGGCAYSDVHDRRPTERLFTFPESDEVEIKAFHGRDGFVAFTPEERRGAQFSRRLLISAFNGLRRNAVSGADPLRDLAHSPGLSYVCVRDENGGRWFANVRVLDYADRRPAAGEQLEYVNIIATELTVVPQIVDATY